MKSGSDPKPQYQQAGMQDTSWRQAMAILDEHTLDFFSHSAEQTRRFGARLGTLLQAGDLLCLEGELGSGKTCLTQGIGLGMGVAEPITSPTFTLVAEYRPTPPAPILYHIDLYRLDVPGQEVWSFGLDDYLYGDGVCIIEWADRIKESLPDQHLWVKLRYVNSGKRGILMRASSRRYDELLQRFRKSAFGV